MLKSCLSVSLLVHDFIVFPHHTIMSQMIDHAQNCLLSQNVDPWTSTFCQNVFAFHNFCKAQQYTWIESMKKNHHFIFFASPSNYVTSVDNLDVYMLEMNFKNVCVFFMNVCVTGWTTLMCLVWTCTNEYMCVMCQNNNIAKIILLKCMCRQ